MPKRVTRNIEFTQGDLYTFRIPMFDGTNGPNEDGTYPNFDPTGHTWAAGITPAVPGNHTITPFAITVEDIDGEIHLVLVLTEAQTMLLPKDCIWGCKDTTLGAGFTFIGGTATVKRKVA